MVPFQNDGAGAEGAVVGPAVGFIVGFKVLEGCKVEGRGVEMVGRADGRAEGAAVGVAVGIFVGAAVISSGLPPGFENKYKIELVFQPEASTR